MSFYFAFDTLFFFHCAHCILHYVPHFSIIVVVLFFLPLLLSVDENRFFFSILCFCCYCCSCALWLLLLIVIFFSYASFEDSERWNRNGKQFRRVCSGACAHIFEVWSLRLLLLQFSLYRKFNDEFNSDGWVSEQKKLTIECEMVITFIYSLNALAVCCTHNLLVFCFQYAFFFPLLLQQQKTRDSVQMIYVFNFRMQLEHRKLSCECTNTANLGIYTKTLSQTISFTAQWLRCRCDILFISQ